MTDDPPDPAATAEIVGGAPLQRIGRYELLEKIGRGGMGVVYRARDSMLGRMVAVKMLHEMEASEETRERFFREARAAGQLTHRNIITVYDFGQEAGRAYLVMELLHGEALTKILVQERKLSLEQSVDIMMRVCDGLAFAHSRSIVHRDVKPANLFLTTNGQVKILDFGVARIASSNLTRVGLIVGTPDYMSPEQVQGRVVDQRSDVFSAGAVFYQLLSGRKPFGARNLPEVLRKVAAEDPPALRDTEAPAELASIIGQALHKDPAERYQQMQDMLADFGRFQQGYDHATRELALKARERYLEIAGMLSEAGRLTRELGVEWSGEEVAVVPLIRDLPQFKDRGADVLRLVPFRRARVSEMLSALQHQRDSLATRLDEWRAAKAVHTKTAASTVALDAPTVTIDERPSVGVTPASSRVFDRGTQRNGSEAGDGDPMEPETVALAPPEIGSGDDDETVALHMTDHSGLQTTRISSWLWRTMALFRSGGSRR